MPLGLVNFFETRFTFRDGELKADLKKKQLFLAEMTVCG